MSTPTSSPLLTVEQLSVSKGDIKLLDSIHFTIISGQSLAIVGPSGSGKSITSLAITRLLPPELQLTNGNVFFSVDKNETVNLAHCSKHQLNQIRGKKISMIFQDPGLALNPVFTCGAQIKETIQKHTTDLSSSATPKVYEWIDRVELPQRTYNAYPHELSGGQLQRVMIAIALCANPTLLIADEPTTSLDVLTQFRILTLIEQLKKELNISILLISHNPSVVKNIADHIIHLDQGKLVPPPPSISFTTSASVDRSRRNDLLKHPIPILTVKGITKTFRVDRKKRLKVLEKVSLTLFKGESLGLTGVSGSGKSTLAKIIAGLIKSEKGEIIRHELLSKQQKLSPKWSSFVSMIHSSLRIDNIYLQYVFQHAASSLNPRMKVGAIIGEPIRYHKLLRDKSDIERKIYSLLTKVKLSPEDFIDRYPHQLSGGEKQRVCIARSLAISPSVLVCDEIWSSLDIYSQNVIIQLLQELTSDGTLSLILISHDIQTLLNNCDRIAILKDGKMIDIDTPQKLLNSEHVYTQDLIQAASQSYIR